LAAADQDALTPYLDRPAPDTFLLMTDVAVDFRKKLFKAIKACSAAQVIELRPLYADELGAWVERRARQKDVRLSVDMAQLVSELSGPDLASMDSALDKLSLYVGKGASPDEAQLRQVLGDTRLRTIFELTRHLGQRDLIRAGQALHQMLDRGESSVGILAMIARHFRLVWRVRDGRSQGLSGRNLATHAGCHPMFVQEYERDAKVFSDERLAELFCGIHDTELALKSTPLDEKVVLDQLLFDVCLARQEV
jgi:DNA polymerase-3 subunit delta